MYDMIMKTYVPKTHNVGRIIIYTYTVIYVDG